MIRSAVHNAARMSINETAPDYASKNISNRRCFVECFEGFKPYMLRALLERAEHTDYTAPSLSLSLCIYSITCRRLIFSTMRSSSSSMVTCVFLSCSSAWSGVSVLPPPRCDSASCFAVRNRHQKGRREKTKLALFKERDVPVE